MVQAFPWPQPPRAESSGVHRRLLTGLLMSAAWFALPGQAAAQANCDASDGGYTCSIAEGTYTSPVTVTEPGDVPSGSVLTVNNAGTIGIGVGTVPSTASGVYGLGASITGDTSVNGGNTSGMNIVNSGAISLAEGEAGTYTYNLYGIWAQQSASGAGSSSAGAHVYNHGTVTVAPAPDTQVVEAVGIWASDLGGPNAGNSHGASVFNDGAIIVTATGQQGAAGIDVFSIGAYQGATGNALGSGGYVSVLNVAPITVDWTWQNVGNNSGVFGIQAMSTGGNGASAIIQNETGGDGVQAGVSQIVLYAGGDVTVTANGTPHEVAIPGLSILNVASPGTPLQGAGLFAGTFGGNGGPGFGTAETAPRARARASPYWMRASIPVAAGCQPSPFWCRVVPAAILAARLKAAAIPAATAVTEAPAATFTSTQTAASRSPLRTSRSPSPQMATIPRGFSH